MKIEQGSILLDQIFNIIARYVRKVHSDEHIRKCLRYSAGRSFLDVIGPGDIAYIVLIIKYSKDMWDQDLRMMCKFPGSTLFYVGVSTFFQKNS
jgi:hypothetical protein